MKCEKCGNKMKSVSKKTVDENGKVVYRDFPVCEKCNIEVEIDTQIIKNDNIEKKKESSLSVIAAILAGVSFLIPMVMFLSYSLSLAGLIVGLIDIGVNKDKTRHLGSIFAIIIFVAILTMFQDKMNNILELTQRM